MMVNIQKMYPEQSTLLYKALLISSSEQIYSTFNKDNKDEILKTI